MSPKSSSDSANTKKTKTRRAKSTKPQKSFEQTLWHTADKLRGSVESAEYKHVDLLLPKLLSGQLQIPEAEQQLAEVN